MNTLPLPVVPESILVVIDMQPQGFPLANSAKRGVMQEILAAMARNWHIIVVEFDLECAGETHSELLALLSGYPHWHQVKKAGEDGSQEIVDFCKYSGLSTKRFRITGVMTDVCVAATTTGLVGLLPDCQADVVKAACACAFSRYDWATFPQSERIAIV